MIIRISSNIRFFLCAAIWCLGVFSVSAVETLSPRERLLFDFGWKFHLGDEWSDAHHLAKAGENSGPAGVVFNDRMWRVVNLPHDWAIELPFDPKADMSHGFKPLGPGFESNSVAWYRRTFDLAAKDSDKRLWLEFDGVFRDCTVFVNGWFVGKHESGYSSFRFDITDVAKPGAENVVAVRVDASKTEGWFYEGAGIYRHVWLVKTAPLAIAPDGIFVYTTFKDNVPQGPADVHIQSEIANRSGTSKKAVVRCEILSPNGEVVARSHQSVRFEGLSQNETKQIVRVRSPLLWSPETPELYRLVTTLEENGEILDRVETTFGVRTVAFDADKGFLLNGNPYIIKGTCNHQDHAGVGSALPDKLQYFRIAKLKEMGGNAYRTSHNPPTPELLEACDRLGMLVLDENRLLGSDKANLENLRGLIRRDRNHPSVFLWSIGNEENAVHTTATGRRVAETMQTLVKKLDPARPVTYAANFGNIFEGVNSVIEVRGWNYFIGTNTTDVYHKEHPQQPNIGTEQASTLSTRGIYSNDPARGYVSAYDENKPPWGNTAEEWWKYFVERPWLSGGFAWTGFDYRGEPNPYSWPCISSHFGILDTCGFPKDSFWYYQSWWSDKTVLHLLPHWNWPGREGQDIDVRVLSNCEEVELILNGRSLGRKTMERNSHLRWNVKYVPGMLKAIGYNKGKAVAETQAETTGKPAAVQLVPDHTVLNADEEDIAIATVKVLDARGRIVPTAANLIQFELEGPGRIIGVGNGDPSCHEPDVYIARQPVRSRTVTGWKWKTTSSTLASTPDEVSEAFNDSDWKKYDIESKLGPLFGPGTAVFRADFDISAEDIDAREVELSFGMIDEDGIVYVNGKKAGESHDWRSSPAFDVKQFFHEGKNTIAVMVENHTGPGGISRGVTLTTQEKRIMPQWKRSVFNGLAQIIIQSTKTVGSIRVIAKSDGLSPAVMELESRPVSLRPHVEASAAGLTDNR